MRGPPSASFEKVLFDEQMNLAPSRYTLRVLGAVTWLGVVVAMQWRGEGPVARALLPVAALYAAYAVLLAIARRISKRPLYLPYATALADVPAMGVMGSIWATASPESSAWACGATTALCLLFMATTCLLLHVRALLATAAVSAIVVSSLFAFFHQPSSRLALALILIAVAAGAGRMLLRLAVTLVRRAFDLAEARVKDLEERARELDARNQEIGQLNEELRHQVAQRSRQLTEALAQLESHLEPPSVELGDLVDGRYRVLRELRPSRRSPISGFRASARSTTAPMTEPPRRPPATGRAPVISRSRAI